MTITPRCTVLSVTRPSLGPRLLRPHSKGKTHMEEICEASREIDFGIAPVRSRESCTMIGCADNRAVLIDGRGHRHGFVGAEAEVRR